MANIEIIVKTLVEVPDDQVDNWTKACQQTMERSPPAEKDIIEIPSVFISESDLKADLIAAGYRGKTITLEVVRAK